MQPKPSAPPVREPRIPKQAERRESNVTEAEQNEAGAAGWRRKHQQPISDEVSGSEQTMCDRSRQHQHTYPRITPELSRPAKRVRLERTVMRAKVNPKPTARNGHAIHGSTKKASASTERVEASRGRSRQRRQSVSHEAIHLPAGANAMRPKPIEAKQRSASESDRSASDQRRSQRRNGSCCITEADNTNTPTHA